MTSYASKMNSGTNSSDNLSGMAALAARLREMPDLDTSMNRGENGTVQHRLDQTGLENIIVALGSMMRPPNQGKTKRPKYMDKRVVPVINNFVSAVRAKPHLEIAAKQIIFRLMAHMRDCRQEGMGKGERDLPILIWGLLYQNFPEWESELNYIINPLFLHYGCAGDARKIWYYFCLRNPNGEYPDHYGKWSHLVSRETSEKIRQVLLEWYVNVVLRIEAHQGDSIPLELNLAKWMPMFRNKMKSKKTGKMIVSPSTFLSRIVARHFINSGVAPYMMKVWKSAKSSRSGMTDSVVFSIISKNMGAMEEAYRRYVVSLRNRLPQERAIVEIAMAGKQPDKINHEFVPGRAAMKYQKAHRNSNNRDDLRESDPEYWKKREQCRVNKEAYVAQLVSGKKKAHGTSVFITELVQRMVGNSPDSHSYQNISESIINECSAMIRSQVDNLEKCAAENGFSLEEFGRRMLIQCDFSGSMSGTPMNLAIGVALVLAPLCGGPFKGSVFTFESEPKLVDLMIDGPDTSYIRMVKAMMQASWGGDTNYYLLHETTLKAIVEEVTSSGLNYEQACDMLPLIFLVITDMQFNIANRSGGGYQTMHQNLTDLYRETGEKLFGPGKGFKLPTMIYWNARGDTDGMPVVSTTPGAMMISGYNTAIFKTFLTAGIDELRKFTPWSYLEKTLMNKWYDKAIMPPEPEGSGEGKYDAGVTISM